MKFKEAQRILQQVRKFYNETTKEFSGSRKFIWKEFRFIKDLVDSNQKVLDLGCGNGRFSELFNQKQYVGIDISENLVEVARKKYPDKKFIVYDGLNLPFSENSFDLVFSIAVFHHLPKPIREKLFIQVKKILKPGGKFLISVWYLWHKFFTYKLILKNLFKKIFTKTCLGFLDIEVPWGKDKRRYVHLFTAGRLIRELKAAGFKIKRSFILKKGKQKNLVVICLKEC